MDLLSPRGVVRRRRWPNCRRCRRRAQLQSSSRRSRLRCPRIREAADRAAPRNFAGKADNPAAQVLQNADIGWTASRGPIFATGGEDMLSLTTPLTGKLNVTGSLSSKDDRRGR